MQRFVYRFSKVSISEWHPESIAPSRLGATSLRHRLPQHSREMTPLTIDLESHNYLRTVR